MRDHLPSELKMILLGSCVALAVFIVTACGGGAEEPGASAVTAEDPGAPAVAAEDPGTPAVTAEDPDTPAVTDGDPGASAVVETPASSSVDAYEMDTSEPQADMPRSEDAELEEEEATEALAPPEEPAVQPAVTALHDGVPVHRNTIGFEEATVEIIDFSDFQ